jgi:hypothetical protein
MLHFNQYTKFCIDFVLSHPAALSTEIQIATFANWHCAYEECMDSFTMFSSDSRSAGDLERILIKTDQGLREGTRLQLLQQIQLKFDDLDGAIQSTGVLDRELS